jgi:hypothetical protein
MHKPKGLQVATPALSALYLHFSHLQINPLIMPANAYVSLCVIRRVTMGRNTIDTYQLNCKHQAILIN